MVAVTVVDVVWARPVRATTQLLDARERARLQALRSAEAADRYACAHQLLRRVLAQRTGADPAALELTATCRTCGGPHGRPELVGHPELHLSLSRAGQRVLVAITTAGPVGVDVELVSATGFDGFTAVALAPSERADTVDERARTWVRKEALLKATRHGLMVEPSAVVLSAPSEHPRLLAWTAAEPPGAVALVDVEVGAGYAACVAVLGAGEPDVHVQGWSPD